MHLISVRVLCFVAVEMKINIGILSLRSFEHLKDFKRFKFEIAKVRKVVVVHLVQLIALETKC